MKKNEGFQEAVPDRPQMTVDSSGRFREQKIVPGDSVEEHKYLETANSLLGGKEIRQQNENL
ncbi:hypothetical protein RCG23_21960 [Neobacillus sp. PS3-34]|uniref:hypothetical protein n=1 Tax=Neobacillus sp. PS3-34 TaxID=3070678 RepID=UPI0027DECDA1|nr:hypothetical protein [Neobacillus sp. PS3-34]WML47943.1 hypothetical protein RCG23_21960 [Neobacillus sp. PS3-34]